MKNWLTSIAEDSGGLLRQTNAENQQFLEMFEDHWYQHFNDSPPFGIADELDFINALNNNDWFDTWFNEIFKFYN